MGRGPSISSIISDALMRGAIGAAKAYEQMRSGVSYIPADRAHQLDPYSSYARLRERDPVHMSPLLGGYILSRYGDCLSALRDPRFSSDIRNSRRFRSLRRGFLRAGGDPVRLENPPMLQSDPPRHTRLRTLVNKAFTPRAVAALEPRIEAVAAELLDGLPRADRFDAIADFAHPLPIIVIAEMLGVPKEDRERFRFWSDEAVLAIGMPTLDEARRAHKSIAEIDAYFSAIIEERRREPRDDLVTALVRAEEDGDRLNATELLGTCSLLLVAGNETSANLIGNGLFALLQNPEQLALLREDPSIWQTVVDELLRYDAPIQLTIRIALEDLEIGGKPLARGQSILTLLASGNRDPDRFRDPDQLDITRVDNPHLGFGHGRHSCLGASLARLEARIALRALLDRHARLELATEAPAWGHNTVIRGLERLPIRIFR